MPIKRPHSALDSRIPPTSPFENERRVRRCLIFPGLSPHHTTQSLPSSQTASHTIPGVVPRPRNASVLARSTPEIRTARHLVQRFGDGKRALREEIADRSTHETSSRRPHRRTAPTGLHTPEPLTRSSDRVFASSTEKVSGRSARVDARRRSSLQGGQVLGGTRAKPHVSSNGKAHRLDSARGTDMSGRRRRKVKVRGAGREKQAPGSRGAAVGNPRERQIVEDDSDPARFRALHRVDSNEEVSQRALHLSRALTSRQDLLLGRLGHPAAEDMQQKPRNCSVVANHIEPNDCAQFSCRLSSRARVANGAAEHGIGAVRRRKTTSEWMRLIRSADSDAIPNRAGSNGNVSSRANPSSRPHSNSQKLATRILNISALVPSSMGKTREKLPERPTSATDELRSGDRRSRQSRRIKRGSKAPRLAVPRLPTSQQTVVSDGKMPTSLQARNSFRRERTDPDVAGFRQLATNLLCPNSEDLDLNMTPNREKRHRTEVIDVDAIISSSESTGNSNSEVEVVEVAFDDDKKGTTLRNVPNVSAEAEGENLVGVDTRHGVRALIDYPHFRFDCGKFPLRDGALQFFCNKCFCFACDEPVAKCGKWRRHQFATREKEKWVAIRKATLERRKSST